ncbi:MAG: NADPH:quinone oxidoreductase family protein [Gammaproteobacteria bacterium]|nr:MAG: NADPH:quinone oxidoreductase family protein [Gammaproteobacteria bacterium]
MKALRCKELGGPEKLAIEEVASAPARGNGVRIRVAAAGLNFPDTLIIRGQYQFRPGLPFTPGGEVAGEVLEVGDKVTRFRPGDRVMGLTGVGAFAEEVVVNETNLMPVPEGMDLVEAAGFPMTYGTSWHALVQRGRLKAGQRLLVLGAGGGVGLAAVNIGAALGAEVIAAASSETKLDAARKAGATHAINYMEAPLKDAVKALTKGQGVDVAYDPVGGELTEQALRCMAWEGRLLIIGFASGTIPQLPANLPLLKGCDVCGVYWGAYTLKDPQGNLQNFIELGKMLEAGRLTPAPVQRFAMSDWQRAFAAMEHRQLAGKAVLIPD